MRVLKTDRTLQLREGLLIWTWVEKDGGWVHVGRSSGALCEFWGPGAVFQARSPTAPQASEEDPSMTDDR